MVGKRLANIGNSLLRININNTGLLILRDEVPLKWVV